MPCVLLSRGNEMTRRGSFSKSYVRVNNSNKTFLFIYVWPGFTSHIKDASLQEDLWKASLSDTAT